MGRKDCWARAPAPYLCLGYSGMKTDRSGQVYVCVSEIKGLSGSPLIPCCLYQYRQRDCRCLSNAMHHTTHAHSRHPRPTAPLIHGACVSGYIGETAVTHNVSTSVTQCSFAFHVSKFNVKFACLSETSSSEEILNSSLKCAH